jgi:hypothetical protein
MWDGDDDNGSSSDNSSSGGLGPTGDSTYDNYESIMGDPRDNSSDAGPDDKD